VLTRLPSYCLVLPAFLAVPLVFLASDPSRAQALGLDVWNVPNLQKSIRESAEFNQDLDVRLGSIRRQTQVKNALAGEVVAGHLSLDEAADRFLALGLGGSAYPPAWERTGSNARERAARTVIRYAAARLPDPNQRDHLVGHLEEELTRLGRTGTGTAERN
jgi:hypothetical protein